MSSSFVLSGTSSLLAPLSNHRAFHLWLQASHNSFFSLSSTPPVAPAVPLLSCFTVTYCHPSKLLLPSELVTAAVP
jgi:hypothetical protein